MKYSENFNRDFNYYLSSRHIFNFDGRLDRDIVFDKNGISGKQCFHKFDSEGKLVATKHPNLVKALLKTKGSINLHIKMWKEDRNNGCLPRYEFNLIVKEYNLPEWAVKAVNKDMDEVYNKLNYKINQI